MLCPLLPLLHSNRWVTVMASAIEGSCILFVSDSYPLTKKDTSSIAWRSLCVVVLIAVNAKLNTPAVLKPIMWQKTMMTMSWIPPYHAPTSNAKCLLGSQLGLIPSILLFLQYKCVVCVASYIISTSHPISLLFSTRTSSSWWWMPAMRTQTRASQLVRL